MTAPTIPEETIFLDQLLARRLLLFTGLPGIYGRGETFVALQNRLDAYLTRHRDPGAITMRFPPVLSRSLVEKSGGVHRFPHLLGCAGHFDGDASAQSHLIESVENGQDWLGHLRQSDVLLAPSACYAVYPQLTGTLSSHGKLVDVESWCYRQEPSLNPMRLRAFRMREFVYAGSAERVHAWRDAWLERGQQLLAELGLETMVLGATDGLVASAATASDSLKYELLVSVLGPRPTAVLSANYHQDHFGDLFEILTPDNTIAHTACIGFGLERLVLALLKTHGLCPETWPRSVQQALA